MLGSVAAVLVACGSGSRPAATATTVGVTTVPSSASPSSSQGPSPTIGPKGGPVPVGFTPVSVTFVSLDTGWVLGTAPCTSPPCTSVVRTSDRGRTWVGIPAPRVDLAADHVRGVGTVRFADPDNGWIYGPELWATHDGGAHWSRSTLPGVAPNAQVSDLEASNGMVHAAVIDGGRVHIETSPVAADAWEISPTTVSSGAGPVPKAQIVLQGSVGWLIEIDRTVVGGARLNGGEWAPWKPPCADIGGPATLAASTPSEMVVVFDEGLLTGVPQVRANRSTDGGTTFQADATPVPLGCCVADVASGHPGTAVVASTTGDGAAVLVATFDEGASWTTVYRAPDRQAWDELGFTSAAQGVAISRESDKTTATLLMTLDGGHSWTPMAFHRTPDSGMGADLTATRV